MATTLGCTAFGTLNGSALVTGSVFAKIAAPEMRRYGYNTNLTYGLIAASGNIGQFIPPSILIVIFGALSGDSIGRLLMAAIAPGLALAIGFSLFTVIAAIVKPSLFPRVEQRFTWKEKLLPSCRLLPCFRSPFLFRRSKYWQPGRRSVTALAPLLCVPPFPAVCPCSDFYRTDFAVLSCSPPPRRYDEPGRVPRRDYPGVSGTENTG